MTTPTTLPCPFCGDPDPAIDQVEVGVHAVVCNGCGCTGPIENYDNASQTAEVAIALWNRRGEAAWPDPDAPREKVAA